MKLIFPFIKTIRITQPTTSVKVSWERLSMEEYFDLGSRLYCEYNLINEYFFAMGLNAADIYNAELKSFPLLEFADTTIPPETVSAIAELAFGLDSFYIDKVQEASALKLKYTKQELGRRMLLNVPSEIPNPLFDFEDEHSLLFQKIETFTSKSRTKMYTALLSWQQSYKRGDRYDSVMYCCMALEALFSLKNDQALKIPLFIYHYLDDDEGLDLIKLHQLYLYRNDITHGNGLPDIPQDLVTYCIHVVSRVLTKVLTTGNLPLADTLEKKILERIAK